MIKREGKENIESSSCLRTVTGTELLLMTSQSSPAEVKVRCFYTVSGSPSPHSNTSTITIHNQTPQLSLQHFPGEYVLFTCSLPGSANHDTRCKLYFGEASDPVSTTTIRSERRRKTQWFCLFTVTADDLLRRLRSVQQSDASCDYSLGSEPKSSSTRSDRYSLTDIKRSESRRAQTQPASTKTTDIVARDSRTAPGIPTFRMTTEIVELVESESTMATGIPAFKMTTDPGNTLTAEGIFTSADTTPVNPAISDEITDKMISMIGAAVTVGVVLLGLVLLFNRSRIETFLSKRPTANVTGKSKDYRKYLVSVNSERVGGYDETYSIVTYECNTE
ncbi:uncharacterized protein AB9X84_010048 [Acanthopagrus schlegelii]